MINIFQSPLFGSGCTHPGQFTSGAARAFMDPSKQPLVRKRRVSTLKAKSVTEKGGRENELGVWKGVQIRAEGSLVRIPLGAFFIVFASFFLFFLFFLFPDSAFSPSRKARGQQAYKG